MIKRYKAKNSIFDIIEADDGHLILLSDMTDVLENFVGMAVKAGADRDELQLLVSGLGKEKY